MTPDASAPHSPYHPVDFAPEEFFTGSLACSGMFVDRFGQVRRRFVVDVFCEPFENGFALHETFQFDDGETEERVWKITKHEDGSYTGQCDDLLGAAKGKLEGPALKWRYQFLLNLGTRKLKVDFDDLMVQQSQNVVLNRAKVRKFGILLGELFITFQRNVDVKAA